MINRTTLTTSLIALGSVLIPLSSSLLADDARIDGLVTRNVRVTGLEGETVSYFQNGNRRIALDKFELLSLDRYDTYATALAALEAGNARQAASTLATLRNNVREDYLKPLISLKLIQALDQAGQYSRALDEYLSLIRSHPNASFANAYPQRFPTDRKERRQGLNKVKVLLQGNPPVAVKSALEELRTALTDPDEATAPAEGDGNGATPAESNGGAAQPYRGQIGDQAVERLVNARQYAEAIRAAEATLKSNRRPTATLYFQKAKAEQGLNRHQDAALSYMRVAIHFERHALASDALVETGHIMKNHYNKPETATKLWQEARERAMTNNQRELIDKLLNSR